MIMRKEYKKKSSKKVKASCVKDRGKKGKGPKTLPPISKDISLSKYDTNLKNQQLKEGSH